MIAAEKYTESVKKLMEAALNGKISLVDLQVVMSYCDEKVDALKDKMDFSWTNGRAFVYDKTGEVEYFSHWEEDLETLKILPSEGTYLRSQCGGVRAVDKCRALNYVKP